MNNTRASHVGALALACLSFVAEVGAILDPDESYEDLIEYGILIIRKEHHQETWY